jgi:aminoglycoside phosphotransferase family enzyme
VSETSGQTLIQALQNPALYDHPVQDFRVIETHISHVLLTGDYAYKIKKPVDFGFLDFSSLARRKHFCEEELRLNRRLADNLYLDVVAITGTPEQPVLGGDGEAIEYAIKMRQFRQEDLLDRRQEQGTLAPELLINLARQTATFHEQQPPVPEDSPLGTPDAVFAPMQDNFDQIRPLLSDPALLAQLDALEDWTRTTFERHRERIARRRAEGFVRECHGDLHLANMTLFEGQVTVSSTTWRFCSWTWKPAGSLASPTWCSITTWNTGAISRPCRCCRCIKPTGPWCGPKSHCSPWPTRG